MQSLKKTQRKSGIELLRIICMLMIIVLHAYTYGGIAEISQIEGEAANDMSLFIWSFFRTPVNIFIIITGYFMSKDVLDFKKSYRRIPKVYATMLFYSVLLTLTAFILYNSGVFSALSDSLQCMQEINDDIERSFSSEFIGYTFAKMLLPIFSDEWYFLTNYVIILLLSPFINKILSEIDKKQFRILLVLLFVFLSIYPTVSKMGGLKEVFSTHKVISVDYGKSLVSFIFMFIIGAYLKRFVNDDEKLHFKYLGYFIGLCLIDFSCYYFLKEVKFSEVLLYNQSVFGQFSNPFVILESVFLFLFFRGFQFRSRLINLIAGATIGIYAIQEHPLMRGYIWSHDWYSGGTNQGVAVLIAVVFGIFIACSVIDMARQGLFKGVTALFRRIFPKKQVES